MSYPHPKPGKTLPAPVTFAVTAAVLLLGILTFPTKAQANERDHVSATYAGGPLYQNPDQSLPELKKSGLNTLIIWTIHIEDNGDLTLNGEFPRVSDGRYIGNEKHPNFPNEVASLKEDGSSVTRVEFGLSAAGSGTYRNVRSLADCNQFFNSCTIDSDNVLSRNFAELKRVFPTVEAVNNDDESEYDVQSSVAFHTMLADKGFKTTVVPYTNKPFWQSFVNGVNANRPGTVDGLYLQTYAGGTGNDPCNWDLGLPVYTGLDSATTPPWGERSVGRTLSEQKTRCDIDGGFMWLYDEFKNDGRANRYANAIRYAHALKERSNAN